jgi:putative restriction endonuclease
MEFGPTRRSNHPEYPFWRLQSDRLWEIPDLKGFRSKEKATEPPIAELRPASGGFPASIDAALRATPALIRELGHEILDAHFPPSLHESLLASVDLDLDPPAQEGARRVRDKTFRELVLRAYGYQCAVCGLDTRLDGRAVGLDAAHVHWHANFGPDVVENGLCLCPLHHKALDLGLIGLSEERILLVSSRLHGGEAVETQIGRFHRRAMLGPQHGYPAIDIKYARWHRQEVFKDPPRAA